MAQHASSPAPPRRARWIGVATALMCALAGGAVWCLIALYARRDLMALSLPIAAAIAWALRAHGFAQRWSAAAIAVACVTLACAYSLYLQATAQVASLLGLPLRSALRQMEPRMAIDIAWANLDPGGIAIFAAACVLAAVGTLWSGKR
ncbi:MAG TPA: hypothetical protein VH375_10225 [Rhodanobacteraceae bacterium]|jgi:hypothetical protein